MPIAHWPYQSTLSRLILALALGLFVGVERERRGKKSGVRTFGFASVLGGLGGMLGESYALLGISLLGLLVIFLNVQTLLREKRSTELTTSAALIVVGFTGILCGQGHILTPAAVAVITVALLAWKEPLAGFSIALKDVELRSAILLAILAFVIYPALPVGAVGPWGIFEPQGVLVTIILIAGLGFVNYILLKVYGTRGIELTGFLGGLVNSSVAVGELASRVRETQGQMTDAAYRGILFAIGAMLIRNAVLLGLLAPSALEYALPTLFLMIIVCALIAFGLHLRPALTKAFSSAGAGATTEPESVPVLNLESPFSLKAALKFGSILLLIQVAGVIAQQTIGQLGIYVVSFFGGLFSSASTVAAVADLVSKTMVSPEVAGLCTIITSLTSVVINLPLVMQSHDARLMKRLSWSVALIIIVGVIGAVAQSWIGPLSGYLSLIDVRG